MMRQFELVERVTSYDPDADESLLNRAYVYAMKAHGDQVRASGDPFFSHPLEVAAILTDLKLDDATVAAALLHDVVEDTATTHREIEDLFGSEISSLVEGLTKIKRLDLITREAHQAENLRKLLLAMSQDVRVLLVKLADRLHNMRTLEHMSVEKRHRIAQETIDIYAPLAGRMGMQTIRDELEDLSFRELNPDGYRTIVERLARLRRESGNVLIEIEEALKTKLEEMHIHADVKGREKRPYSIWRKMERKQLSLGQLSDIFGFRVLVQTVDECYRSLGVAHRTWRMVPGRFKDYISNPKQNDYRSIHTTIIGPHHMRVELQIRTQAMHEVAERGVAAHGFYKDFAKSSDEAKRGVKVALTDSNAYRWLRKLVDILSEGDSPKEFLEHTRLELFSDQVFCFTPKGDLIALPKGANAIDFAYAVHTDIGNSCVGCRINGRHAPLMTELENGDEVEVIRSKAQVPPAAWEGLAVTGKARAAIRRATRMAVRNQYAGLGREIMTRLLQRHGREYAAKEMSVAFPKLGIKLAEDGLAALGRGEIQASDVLKALGIEPDAQAMRKKGRDKGIKLTDGESHVAIRGINSSLPVTIAPDTGAVPGERIVGIITPGQGITVYPIFSKALSAFEEEPERWMDLAWDTQDETARHPARIRAVIHNEPGALAQLTQAIGENDGNIENLQMTSRAHDFFDIDLVIAVHDLRQLNRILEAMRNKPLVSTAYRVTGQEPGDVK